MDKKILDKIKKCLALAQSSNANEAATALRQAQALMKQHGISETDLELSDISQTNTHASNARKPGSWLVTLITVVAEAFGCDPLLSTKLGGCDATFIGHGANPEIAEYAFTVLLRQVRRDRTQHIQNLNNRIKSSTKTRRGDLFALAWVNEVAGMIQKTTINNKTATLIEAYKEREFGELGQTKGREHKTNKRDKASALAGRVAGRKAKLHAGMNGDDRLRIGDGV